MKHSIALASLILFVYSSSAQYNQNPAEGMNYSNPLQIDSSENYIIGTMVNKTSRCKYTSDLQYQYNYLNIWTDVKIYNTSSKQTKKLFSSTPISICPLMGNYINNNFNYGGYKGNLTSGFTKDKIVLLVKTDEYNNDGINNESDPLYIFLCTKDGNNLTQICPKEMNITSFNMSVDERRIIITAQKDKNANKLFTDEDELLYQVDLDDDISKIKLIPISL